MKTIIANKQFMDAVKQGKKTQTIRFWKRKSNIKPGEIVNLFNYRDKMPVRVKRIYEKPLTDLTTAEAKRNGYKKPEDLIDAVIKTYKGIPPMPIVVVLFEPI